MSINTFIVTMMSKLFEFQSTSFWVPLVRLWPAAPDRVYRESHGHELGPIPMTPASSARGNTKSTHFRPTKWVDLTGDIIWEMVLDHHFQRCPPLSLFQGIKSTISGPNRLCGGSRLFPGVGGDLSPKYGLFPSNIPTIFFGGSFPQWSRSDVAPRIWAFGMQLRTGAVSSVSFQAEISSLMDPRVGHQIHRIIIIIIPMETLWALHHFQVQRNVLVSLNPQHFFTRTGSGRFPRFLWWKTCPSPWKSLPLPFQNPRAQTSDRTINGQSAFHPPEDRSILVQVQWPTRIQATAHVPSGNLT